MKRILAFLLACSMVLCLMGCQTSPETNVPTQGQLETPSTSTSGTPDTQPTNPDLEPTTPVHVHTWTDATCVRPKTCAECGETEGAPQGHNWLDATTTAPKTCSVCGAQDGDVIFDIPEDVPVFIPENECFEENTTVIVDEIVGGEAMERIDAVMEDFAEKYVAYSFTATKDEEIVQPTGKLTVTFAIPEGYSDNITVFYVAEDGTLEKLEGTVDPVARTITVELSHFSDYIVVDEGSAEHEHAPVAGATSAPTCVDPGYTTYRCDCGYTYLADRVEPTGHSYGKGVITEPGCIQDGKTTYTCHCGHSYDEPIPATGHSWSNATCTDPRTCAVCKFTEGTAAGHTWVDATCTAPKTCSVCQATEGAALGHKWSEATCTSPKTCSVCQTTDGDALGHKWVDANCTTAKTCSVCQTTEGDPLGHKWSDATCTSPKTCSVCQATEGTVAEHPWDEGVITKEATEEAKGEKLYTCTACKTTRTEVIPELDHVHLYDKVEVTAPTCTEKGFTTRTCRCGEKKVDTETPATGHSYESKVTAPTCTEKGYTTHTCHCGDTYKDSETPATGHSYESKVTAPTCTEKGYTTHTCHCGDTYTDGETAATGHSWKNATCEKPKSCTKCTATEGVALGHNWQAATCEKPKTCSTCGSTSGSAKGHAWTGGSCTEAQTCSACNAKGAAKGHTWNAATCTAPKTCKACKATTGNALGHSFKNNVCSRCNWRTVGSQGLQYQLSDDGTYYTVIKGCNVANEETLIIPSEYNGIPVKKIGDGAFDDMGSYPDQFFTRVIISEGITHIGKRAFWFYREIKSISLPDSLISIGDQAFAKSGLTSLSIPSNVSHIGIRVFEECPGTLKITVDKANPYFSSDSKGVLFNKAKTSLLFVPAGIIKTYTIPSSVTHIGDYVFYNCGMTSINIPEGITSIGNYAFAMVLSDIGGNIFVTSIKIANSVTVIGDYAFAYCSGVTSLILPNSLTTIGEHAFYQCNGIKSVTVPSSVTSIGYFAFPQTTQIVLSSDKHFQFIDGILYNKPATKLIWVPRYVNGSVNIPEGVTSIGTDAFIGIRNLTSLTIPGSVTSIGENTFKNHSALTSVIIQNGVATIGDSAFYGCTSLTSLTFPNSLITIGDSAFYGCTGLTSLTFPDSLTAIGDSAFSGCDNVTVLTMGKGLTSVGVFAFPKEERRPGGPAKSIIKEIHVSNIVSWLQISFAQETLGMGLEIASRNTNPLSNGAKLYLNGVLVTDVVIPKGATCIGDYAFYNYECLNSITFCGDVPKIGKSILKNCTVTAYYPAGNTTWTEDVMKNYGGTITWVAYDPSTTTPSQTGATNAVTQQSTTQVVACLPTKQIFRSVRVITTTW